MTSTDVAVPTWRFANTAERLREWHMMRTTTAERVTRLMRVGLGLGQGASTHRVHEAYEGSGHSAANAFGQLTIWPGVSAAAEGFAADLYVQVLSRIDDETERSMRLDLRARELVATTIADFPDLLPQLGTLHGFLDLEAVGYEVAWGRVLLQWLNDTELIEVSVARCERCSAVRSLGDLTRYVSSARRALYTCAVDSPPPDRLGLEINDGWGCPCSCSTCRQFDARLLGTDGSGDLEAV